ncbi:MAG: DUF2141 domain-containing protein [Bacteroidota bacterium]
MVTPLRYLLLLLATPVLLGTLPQQEVGTVRVVLTGMENDDGAVRIALFDSEATFTNTAVRATVLPVVDGRAVWVLDSLAVGDYAVAAFHDENDDGTMDQGLFGIPSEAYGFSNGARGRFGPPTWEDARFEFDGTTRAVEVPIR